MLSHFTPLSHAESPRRLPRCWSFAVAAALIVASVAPARDITISLSTDADASNILLHQPFRVAVSVSGLLPGQELEFLAVTVGTDAFRLGTPAGISAGPIVPAASPGAFLSATAPGLADASFYATSPARIATNGVFFSFDLTPDHAGSAALEVTFTEALRYNRANPAFPFDVPVHTADPLQLVVFCPADFNSDGGVDGGDVFDFFATWEEGLPLSDVNGDGGIDGADVDTFFAAWESAGC